MKNNSPEMGKVVISSGGAVYGTPQYLPLDESHPANPIVPYGITKLSAEKYIQMFEHLYGITGIILRVSNPYGARQRPESGQGAISTFIHRALKNKELEIWGDGNVVRITCSLTMSQQLSKGQFVTKAPNGSLISGPDKVNH
ncbi:MAG: NAD-dependent epimerase/dehydratase family protein [Saprospiraceae bacterium]|nr:NAD-dependent epimerase/dehydratase family protein [Saprospiraceae bacterium]